MAKNKEMRICKCGKIHFINEDDINQALDEDKEVLLICARCGQSFLIGGYEFYDEMSDLNRKSYMMYTSELYCKNGKVELEKIDFNEDYRGIGDLTHSKPFYKIIYSEGIRVPLKNGNYANHYFADIFSDMEYPDFLLRISPKYITKDEIFKYIEDWKVNRRTVDMERFIFENKSEDLDVISCYLINAFDWEGTPYKKW